MLPFQLNILSLEVETSGYDSLILYFTVNIAHMQTESSCNVVVVVVVDFIILLGESQQALPFYWEP